MKNYQKVNTMQLNHIKTIWSELTKRIEGDLVNNKMQLFMKGNEELAVLRAP